MKSDNELNRLIAERVMGKSQQVTAVTGTPDGFGIRLHMSPLPNYCTDPAAWGALFVWLAELKLGPGLNAYFDGKSTEALVCKDIDVYKTRDPLPGRALVLATLAAYGVDIEA